MQRNCLSLEIWIDRTGILCWFLDFIETTPQRAPPVRLIPEPCLPDPTRSSLPQSFRLALSRRTFRTALISYLLARFRVLRQCASWSLSIAQKRYRLLALPAPMLCGCPDMRPAVRHKRL